MLLRERLDKTTNYDNLTRSVGASPRTPSARLHFTLPSLRERRHNRQVLFPFINIPFNDIRLYQRPVDARCGPRKLIEICRRELGREPKVDELFLFFNSARDSLRLFWRDRTGTNDIIKVLPKAGFILPARKGDVAFIPIKRTMIEKLFRSTRVVPSPPGAISTHPDPVRKQRVLDTDFVEISTSGLQSMLSGASHRPPKRPGKRKTGLKADNVLPFKPKRAPANSRNAGKNHK